MQISSRFTIAVHVLIAIETFKNDHKIAVNFLRRANVNPTVIRRLLQQLKKAEINSEAKRRCRYREILDGDNASGCLQRLTVEPGEMNSVSFSYESECSCTCATEFPHSRIMNYRYETECRNKNAEII